MKVAIPSEGPDLDARVGDRLGLSPYLLIVDLESKDFEALRSRSRLSSVSQAIVRRLAADATQSLPKVKKISE